MFVKSHGLPIGPTGKFNNKTTELPPGGLNQQNASADYYA